MKKYLSIFFAVLMTLSVMLTPEFAVKSDAAWASYTPTGNGAADMVALAKLQLGKTRSQLGYTTDWCNLFIIDLAKKVGQSAAIPHQAGYVSTTRNAIVKAGATVVTKPQAGDLVFYQRGDKNWSYAHMGMVIDNSGTTIHGNFGTLPGKVQKYPSYNTFNLDGMTPANGKIKVTFLRPKYTNTGYTRLGYTGNAMGTGNFYITNRASGKALTAASNAKKGNVAVKTNTKTSLQTWKITRSGAKHSITVKANANLALNPFADTPANGTNVNLYTVDRNDTSQLWYFDRVIGTNYYYIRNVKKPSLVVAANGTTDGSNVCVKTYSATDTKQQWLLKSASGLVEAPVLTDAVCTQDGVKITWGAVPGAPKYRVFYRPQGVGTWTQIGETTGTSFTHKRPTSGKTYIYTVSCIKSDSSAAISGYLAGLSKYYVAAPKLQSAKITSTGTVIKWTASAGAERYVVYRKDDGKWVYIGNTTGTSFTDTTQKSASKIYTVRCKNSALTAFTSAYYTAGITSTR